MLDPRSKTKRSLALLAASLLVGALPEAWAGSAEARNPAAALSSPGGAIEDPCLSDKPCSDLYESAQALSKSGQYAAAVANYESAYRMHPMPWLLVNIGRVHQKRGNPKSAIESYQRYFATPDSDREASTNAKAREYLRQAEDDLKRPKKPSVIREREISSPRPLWRILTGTGLVTLGAVGLGMGIAGLALNGTCADSVPMGTVCDRVYATMPSGVGLTVTGGLVAAAGAVLLAWPGRRAVVQVDMASR